MEAKANALCVMFHRTRGSILLVCDVCGSFDGGFEEWFFSFLACGWFGWVLTFKDISSLRKYPPDGKRWKALTREGPVGSTTLIFYCSGQGFFGDFSSVFSSSQPLDWIDKVDHCY